jgi:integrase
MPKLPAGRTPTYRHHKPSGQAVVTLDGRDHYLGPFGSPASRAEYDRLVSLWLANGRTLMKPGAPPPGLTVSELLARYREFAVSYYQAAELGKIKLACRTLRKLYGATRAAEFDADAFEAVRRAMVAQGLARTTINYHLGKVRRVLAWGVRKKLIPAEVLVSVKSVGPLLPGREGAREPEPVRPVEEAHVLAVLPHLRPPVAAMVRLQMLTAMRPGEVIGMTTGQIDRSGELWVYRPRQHKTLYRGKAREVVLGPRAVELLRPWLRADADVPLFSPIEDDAARQAQRREARKTPLTPSQRARQPKPDGKRRPTDWYDKDSYNRAIRRACGKAGVPPWSANRLRHLAATRIRREFGLEAAQVVLGHSHANVTQVYAEANRDRAAEVLRRIG